MKPNHLSKLPNINISHLVAFVELSSSLNFTKAARILHTSQPNLSKIIDKVESELEVTLFNRDTRSVTLTAAGKQLRKEIVPLLNNLHMIIQDLQQLDREKSKKLNIGVLGSALMHHLPLITQEFHRLFPNISLNINDYDMSSLDKCLNNPEYDIVFAPEILSKDSPINNQILFYSEAICLVTNKSNPISKNNNISLHEIDNINLVMPSKEHLPLDHKFIIQMLDSLNLNYNIVAEANTMLSLALMVESGIGCTFLAQHMNQYYSNLAFIKANEFSNNFNIFCLWKNNNDPDVLNFINLLKQYIEQTESNIDLGAPNYTI